MGLGKRAAEDGEVLAEDEDEPPVDGTPAGDDAVARNGLGLHAEIMTTMLDEHVPLLEGAGIEQKLETLARRQLALVMLCLDPARAASGTRRRALLLEPLEFPAWSPHPFSRPAWGGRATGGLQIARSPGEG